MNAFSIRTIERDKFLLNTLQINSKISMKIIEGNYAGIYPTRVEDNSPGHLTISGPLYKGTLVPLTPHADVLINCVADNGVYEFRTRVHEVRREPLYQVVLAIPDGEEIRHLQRREFVRLDYHLKVQYQILGEGDGQSSIKSPRREAFTKNISGNGICLIMNERVSRNTRLDIYLPLFEGKPPIYLMGEVVRSDEAPDGSERKNFNIGIRYIEIRLTDQDRIVKFIFDMERQKVRKD